MENWTKILAAVLYLDFGEVGTLNCSEALKQEVLTYMSDLTEHSESSAVSQALEILRGQRG